MAPLVLVHGFGVDHRMWEPLIPHMQSTDRVWMPDLPGFGEEPPLPEGQRTLVAYAEWLHRGLAQRFSNGDRPILIGYSMGGTLTLLAELLHPGTVGGLVLSCTSAHWGAGLRGVLGLGFSTLGPFAMDLFVSTIRLGYRRHAPDSALCEAVDDMVRRGHRPSMTSLFRSLAGLDLKGRLGQVAAPTLVVAGRRDFLAPLSHARVLSRGIGGSRLHVFPEGDHLLCVDHGQEYASVLSRFLKEVGERSSRER